MRAAERARPSARARPTDPAPPRGGAAKPVHKVAPWEQWKRLPLRARPGKDGYPVIFEVSGLDAKRNARYSALITAAAHKHFKIAAPPREDEGPAAYLVGAGAGKLRVVYDEVIVQFEPHVGAARSNVVIAEAGFRVVERSALVKDQWIVRDAWPGVAGESLLAAADRFERFEEVRFAWPNSVAEYRRASDGIPPKSRRWWLDKMKVNYPSGNRRVREGDADIVIAVLDDGVDIDHPNLENRLAADPGRDFDLLPGEQGHEDPRPKKKIPSDDDESDYHGTLCAGIVCSDGEKREFWGVAPGCKLVAVRVFAGADLVHENRLASAIRWATDVADVILCSWTGEDHGVVIEAFDDTRLGRGNEGTVLVCAAGNDGTDVDFPARHSRAIAIGACGPEYQKTDYSNFGDNLHVVAPSSHDDTFVYSTDVSVPDWGFNTSASGDAGLFWDEFSQTSAAAAMARASLRCVFRPIRT